MSEPFIGEIRMFGGNFAPRGWALCDGQLLAISQNDALFSLLGTIYGGDGQNTFGLPDLRGRVVVHQGTGPGLTPRPIGQKSGVESVALTEAQMPSHSHAPQGSAAAANAGAGPAGSVMATTAINVYGDGTPDQPMAAAGIATAGGSQPHTNMAPFTCVNHIIALVGIYPSRN